MTNEDRPPLAQRLDILARKVPNRIALRCVQVDAAKTILMLQCHADWARFRNELEQWYRAYPADDKDHLDMFVTKGGDRHLKPL